MEAVLQTPILSLVTGPAVEPISIDEAKAQTRQEEDDDNTDFVELIKAARERCEQATQRQLITATWDVRLDRFPCGRILELPRPMLQSVSSVTYLDSAGVSQTFAASNYRVTAPIGGERPRRGRIALKTGVSWPVTADEIEAVTIRFVAGYGDDPENVPARLKMAMRADLATLYLHREDWIAGRSVAMTDRVAGVYRMFRSWAFYP